MDINEYKDGLFVSKCGRVFKEATYTLRGNRSVKYKCVMHKKKRIDLHRIVAEVYLENPLNKPWVLHNDDDASNNKIENLRWGTPKENSQDAYKNGRFNAAKERRLLRKKYERDSKRTSIMELIKQGVRYKEIAEKFNVHPSRISQIVKEEKMLDFASC